ncbi:MAG: (2Fe-2S)-binding protein [Bacillota bacterium]
MNAETVLCRCEEVTREEILEAIAAGATTVDGIKRRTRAGMGLCQGKTCSRLVARELAQVLNTHPAHILPPRPRPPVRPVKISDWRCNHEG